MSIENIIDTIRSQDCDRMKAVIRTIDELSGELEIGRVRKQITHPCFPPKLEISKRSLVKLAKNQVMIIPVETDRYGRTVAEVMAAVSGSWGIEMSLQEEMLKSGNAYYYRKYAANCPNHSAFERTEEIGRSSKVGVWGILRVFPLGNGENNNVRIRVTDP